ncbi:hypothetical protein, partial [Neobacillus novalis]|uniref:hypothetical protein n=1 Tax=Neobacillus novalis TaxID=220687 RepID=UPI001C3F4389
FFKCSSREQSFSTFFVVQETINRCRIPSQIIVLLVVLLLICFLILRSSGGNGRLPLLHDLPAKDQKEGLHMNGTNIEKI